MRFVRPLLTAFMLVGAGPAFAAGPGYQAEGTYERKGEYAQSAKIIAIDAPDQFAASFSTGIKGCGGGVDMNGRAVSVSEILFTKKGEDGELCRIRVRFAPGFQSATVTEDNCQTWHGAACDFEGTLKRTSR